jgi:SAM-dependent methyltransferase
MSDDIPSPIDLRQMNDAREWESTAMVKRPWRTEFFSAFASSIEAHEGINAPCRILELGSGPGFLAEHLLSRLPCVNYVALDFSGAMHALAAERLGILANRVQFVERSFLDHAWSDGLGKYQHVITNQAVHELRHKRRASLFHAQVRETLAIGGSYLVCDHFAGEGGMSNDQLYMQVSEQKAALLSAGFSEVEQMLLKGGLVLHRAI